MILRAKSSRSPGRSHPSFSAFSELFQQQLLTTPADPAAEMLKRAFRVLAETNGEPWVNKAAAWNMIRRVDPTFDPKDHGHANFAEMVKTMDAVVEIKKGETDHMLRLR